MFVTSHDGTVVCENTEGSGLDWQLHPFSDGGSCRAYCSDIDLDGDLDLAVASTYPTHRLAWWRVTGFLQSGWLESSILDTGCDPQWASIDWTAIEPAGTDMSIQYRSSDDPGDLGAWSDPIQTPCYLSGLLDRHFQYRVNLMTTDPAVSPILYDITLNWDPTGIEGPGRPETLTVSPCPASDHVLIEIPGGVQGRILVVDVAGRVVSTFEAGGTESPYTWDAGGMPAGVYTVLFDSSEWSSTERVVVIH